MILSFIVGFIVYSDFYYSLFFLFLKKLLKNTLIKKRMHENLVLFYIADIFDITDIFDIFDIIPYLI